MYALSQSLLIEEKSKKYYKLLSKIEKYEQITDNLEHEIANFLTRVSEGEISHESSVKIRAMLKIIDDMESVGDSIYQLSRVIDNLKQAKLKFTTHQIKSLNELALIVRKAFDEMNLSIEKDFTVMNIEKADLLEKKINNKRNELRSQHIEDLKSKKYKHKTGSYYSDMFSINEKIGDYIINVSEAIQEYQETK